MLSNLLLSDRIKKLFYKFTSKYFDQRKFLLGKLNCIWQTWFLGIFSFCLPSLIYMLMQILTYKYGIWVGYTRDVYSFGERQGLMKRQLEIAVAQVKAKQTWACLLSTNGRTAW